MLRRIILTAAFAPAVLTAQEPFDRAMVAKIRDEGLNRSSVWATLDTLATVIGRDVAIVCVATSITVMTGFRGFKPSWLGKASTFVQVLGVLLVLIAAVFHVDNGLFLPTTYAVIAAFAVASGVHYIYHVARLMKAAEKAG